LASKGGIHTGWINLITLVLPLAVVILASCSGTRHVPDDRYLLGGYKFSIDNQSVDRKELATYIKPKPNRKILGYRFYLGLYNLSGENKDGGFNRWLRKIGEEPIIFDKFDTDKNNKQIGLYLRNKGYYYSEVGDSVRYRKQKANVRYNILTGTPYLINNISYTFEDTTIRQLVLSDTLSSLIKRGSLFDTDLLQEEKTRIEGRLKQNGYYNFTKEYIVYRADTLRSSRQVNINIYVKAYNVRKSEETITAVPHRKYRISGVSVYMDYDPKLALANTQEYIEGLNSTWHDVFEFLYSGSLKTNPSIVGQCIFIFPGAEYRIGDVQQTYQHLGSLRIFKLVNIEFTEPDTSAVQEDGFYPLHCHIQLAPMTLQNYTVELTGTNSSGNFGVAGNLNYLHRNLFGGAENFSFGIKGAVETLRESYNKGFGNMVEFGVESRITLPKFLIPFRHESFIRKYRPKSNLSIAYNFQRRPDYTRTVANTAFGYSWRGNTFNTHLVNPVEINLVRLRDATNAFWDYISGTYLEHSFEDKLIQAVSYSFLFNNQDIKKMKDFVYLRYHAESSGLLLSTGGNLVGNKNNNNRYELLGTEFSQYIKSDFDFRYYHSIDQSSSIVYRIFAGAAWPYGNSIAMPFEKQYFSGGANGLRAWQVRNLGPGSYVETTHSSYPNKTADVKLEGNLEYRFKLFWLLEGAMFVDAGNVWAIRPKDDRPGALFRWDAFYREIAVGSGFGIRMDFNYFIFRLDLGIKIKDPALPAGERWIPGTRGFMTDDLQLNLAIGYPF
jgi:outer membrane protein assembly factor BamA